VTLRVKILVSLEKKRSQENLPDGKKHRFGWFRVISVMRRELTARITTIIGNRIMATLGGFRNLFSMARYVCVLDDI
jgi:hypothetical protein